MSPCCTETDIFVSMWVQVTTSVIAEVVPHRAYFRVTCDVQLNYWLSRAGARHHSLLHAAESAAADSVCLSVCLLYL